MVEVIETITHTLEKMNINKELIEAKNWDQLKKIENILIKSFNVQEEYRIAIKDTKPSINKIAIKSGISRQTFYNNPLLKIYAEYRITEYDSFDITKKNERLLERISDLESKVKLMSERDVSIELLRRKIAMLENNIIIVKKENKELYERYNNVIKKNNQHNDNSQPTESKIKIFPPIND